METFTRYRNTEHNRKTRLLGRIKDVFASARAFHSSADTVSERHNAILASPDWQRASGLTQAYLDGYFWALWDAHIQATVYAYLEPDGSTRLASTLQGDEHRIYGSDPYRKSGLVYPDKTTAWYAGPDCLDEKHKRSLPKTV